MAKKHFISFAGGKRAYLAALKRIVSQAQGFGAFDSVQGFTPADLDHGYEVQFPDFPNRFKTGYGLWSWKPYLINRELAKLTDGDLLFYVDSGCEVNFLGKARFQDYLDMVDRDGIVLFRTQLPHKNWAKKDPMLLPDDSTADAGQVEATWMILKASAQTRTFVAEWLALCAFEGGRLLMDPDGEPQDPWFQAHRHDQACLHVTAHRLNLPTQPEESFVPRNWLGNLDKRARDLPILALRNRQGRPSAPWLRKYWLF